MNLKNFRIVRLDDKNLTYEEYKEVQSKRTGEFQIKWTRVGGYYSKLDQCLSSLKNYIINTYLELEDYQDVLSKIDELNGAIVRCKISIPDDEL